MPSALGRALLSIGAGVALAGLLLLVHLPLRLALLAGWISGGLVLFALAWTLIWHSRPEETQRRAAGDDPGRTAVYLLVLLGAGASIFATTALVGRARKVSGAEGDALIALCLVNMLLSWGLTHTTFALRYAHLYYREDDEGVGGVEFAGKAPPCYCDFAYLAFTVGMCFQVSDTSISSPQIRRAVLLHATLSFLYNTAIIAFVLNALFNFAG